jgi:23S rRNA A2030 N6-methylase RlmJ
MQARDEGKKDVLVYIQKGYEAAQSMLDKKEPRPLQLCERFLDMKVNWGCVNGIQYGRERLKQRTTAIAQTPSFQIRNSTNQPE